MSRQTLSWHPYLDQFGPRYGAMALVGITGIFALSELYSNWIAPMFQGPGGGKLVEGTTVQGGQFNHRLRVHDQPIPFEEWPTNHEGKKIFQPTYDWQDVPDGVVCPPGLEFNMDMQTNRRKARAIRPR